MKDSRLATLSALAALAALALPARAAQWRAEIVPTPGPVRAVETVGGEAHVQIGGGWFRIVVRNYGITLAATAKPLPRPRPAGFLPDGRIAEGRNDIARAWFAGAAAFAGPALGEAGTAGALVIERRDRKLETVPAGDGAAFEDIEPRIVELAPKRDSVIAIKTDRDRGSAIAVIGERDGRAAILAETPPDGASRWLNPAGIADFDGDGATDVALVRGPHDLGRLELWTWRAGAFERRTELAGVTNHVAGSRALRMGAVADFDGDGRPDLAVPAFDRRALRLVAFGPEPRELARVPLPFPAATEAAAVKDGAGHAAILIGLENGALAAVRRVAGR